MVAGVIHASGSASAPGNAISLTAIVCLVRKDIMLQDNVFSARTTVKDVQVQCHTIVMNVTKVLQYLMGNVMI